MAFLWLYSRTESNNSQNLNYLSTYYYENLPNSVSKLPKIGYKVSVILNQPLSNSEIYSNFYQSGDISPNLIALMMISF